MYYAKCQEISEGFYGAINSPKKLIKKPLISALASKKWSDQKNY